MSNATSSVIVNANSYESMAALLNPLGLYNLESGYAAGEMRAFAAGIDTVGSAFDELLMEAFPETAQSFGLALYESAMGLKVGSGSVQDRQQRVCAALALNNSYNTADGLKRSLAVFGMDAVISEDYQNEKIIVTADGCNIDFLSFDEIAETVKQMLPSHLGADLNIKAGTWYFWNRSGLSFAAASGKSFSGLSALTEYSCSY